MYVVGSVMRQIGYSSSSSTIAQYFGTKRKQYFLCRDYRGYVPLLQKPQRLWRLCEEMESLSVLHFNNAHLCWINEYDGNHRRTFRAHRRLQFYELSILSMKLRVKCSLQA